jgi:hypothetical protein
MTNEQEIKAKALEIAALILGTTRDRPVPHQDGLHPLVGKEDSDITNPYLLVAKEFEKYIRQD